MEGSDPAVPGIRKRAIEVESGGEDNNSQHTLHNHLIAVMEEGHVFIQMC